MFHRIRVSFVEPELPWDMDEPEAVCAFLETYARLAFGVDTKGNSVEVSPGSMMTERGRFGSVKKVWGTPLCLCCC